VNGAGSGKRLVVIGGTAAGLSAASKAKRTRPDLEVEVYERSGFVSYGACGLPYYVGGLVASENDLVSLTRETLEGERGIRTFIRCEATGIDVAGKTVAVENLTSGERRDVAYDFLVLATGASPVIPELPGIRSEGVFFLRTVEDGMALRSAVRAPGARTAVLVGGGFIGLEMAEQFAQNGLRVTIVEALPMPLPFLGDEYSAIVRKELEENGVRLLAGTTVDGIVSEGGRATGVRVRGEEILEADIVVVSVGVRPNSALAEKAGLRLGVRNAIAVDETMKTSNDSIWACGDCVQTVNLVTGRPAYVPLGTTANKQGRVAGANIVGERAAFRGVLASQATKVFSLYVASTGVSPEQAAEVGFDAGETKIVKQDRASYYPGGRDNRIRLVYDRRSGRLLGAQAVGSESVAGRINVCATAISAGMTVGELNDVDFVYAPPVAPVYDPILIAAGSAMKGVRPGATPADRT
jgi:NADPH-dependent 2,4-dienoyl-CoA reductase/sulfur reductase-like enzyme